MKIITLIKEFFEFVEYRNKQPEFYYDEFGELCWCVYDWKAMDFNGFHLHQCTRCKTWENLR